MLSSFRSLPVFNRCQSPFIQLKNQFNSISSALYTAKPFPQNSDTQQFLPNMKGSPQKFFSQRQSQCQNMIEIGPSSQQYITFNCMNQQLNWFAFNCKTHIHKRLFAVFLLIVVLWAFGVIELALGTCLAVYIGLQLGLRKYYFGRSGVSIWAYCSKILTIWLLTHQMLIRVSERVASISGSKSQCSVVQSLHAMALLMLFQLNFTMLVPFLFDSWKENLHNLQYSIASTALRVWTVKWAVLQICVLILAATSVLLIMFNIPTLNVYDILSPQTIAEILVTAVGLILIELVCHTFLFNPVLLSGLPHHSCPKNEMGTPVLIQLLKTRTDSHKISEQLTDLAHLECLKWIRAISAQQSDFLSTKVKASKFYHSYCDVFTEFSEYALKHFYVRLSSALTEAKKMTNLQLNRKKIHQDVFFEVRNVGAKIRLQSHLVGILSSLQTFSSILQLIAIRIEFDRSDVRLITSELWQELSRIETAVKELADEHGASQAVGLIAKVVCSQVRRTVRILDTEDRLIL